MSRATSAGDTAISVGSKVLELVDVQKLFPIESSILKRTIGHVAALSGVSLSIPAGETIGLVGESGSGKSTLGRVILGLTAPTRGEIRSAAMTASIGRRSKRNPPRARVQGVFQNPYSSFDPVQPLMSSMGEPVRRAGYGREAARERVLELTRLVGLEERHLRRYPDELSGGQLQRLSIARAMSVEPALVVLDEAVSALDLSTQGSIVNLLGELQQRYDVSYLFISHDPSIVYHASRRVAVMYLGEIVEVGPAETVFDTPRHPYTQALLSAVPVPDPQVQKARKRIILHGDAPDGATPPSGCRFHTRCPYAMDICRVQAPAPYAVADSAHEVRCHLHTTGPALNGRPLPFTLSHPPDSGST